ncbi:hypothetical protein HK405_009236 [Cladochytrium tenue]|nr:hypothetical protein HK405_009236 [Cladochytrium tenue]
MDKPSGRRPGQRKNKASTRRQGGTKKAAELVAATDGTAAAPNLAVALPERALQTIFDFCLELGGASAALLGPALVCRAWREEAQAVLWQSPAFFSLSGMMKMHQLIQQASKALRSARRGGGLRGMLGLPLAEGSGGGSGASGVDSEGGAVSPPAVCPERVRRLASLVRAVSYSYYRPSDRKFPTSFDVQAFLSETLPGLECLRLSGSPDWIDDSLLARLAAARGGRGGSAGGSELAALRTLELVGATERMTRAGLRAHLPRLSGLESLTVVGSRALDDATVAAVAAAELPRLRRVSVVDCENVSAATVEQLCVQLAENGGSGGGDSIDGGNA